MREILDTYVDSSFDAAPYSALKYAHFVHNYRALFPTDRSARVLDIGIGRGEMLDLMRTWGYSNYHGIDVSPSTVAHCRARGLSCEQVEDCTRWLNERPGTYTLITLLDVIEHLERNSLIPFMKAIRGALIPGGQVIVQTPNLQAPEAYLHRYQDITHHLGFSEHALFQVAVAAGFSRLECFGFETMVFLGWSAPRTYVDFARRGVRSLVFALVRLLRASVGNPNPKVLHPILAAVMGRAE